MYFAPSVQNYRLVFRSLQFAVSGTRLSFNVADKKTFVETHH
jgi:hypothetical protein